MICLVLGDDHREQRLLERVRLALEGPETVAEDVQVLRREGHEARVPPTVAAKW